jgi:clan AA aspartic protease (TIGR02281 family)
MRHQGVALSVLLFVVTVPYALAPAYGQDAVALLTEKGLKKVKPYFMLGEEVELGKLLRDGATMRKKVLEAQKKADAAEKMIDEKKKLILTYTAQRRLLRIQMENTRNVDAYNKMVTAINELADRITLLEKSEEHEKAARAARAAAHLATEEYAEFLLKAERLYKKINEQYADLAADPKVRDAIAEVSKAEEYEYRLGPGRAFASAGKRLEGLLQQVVSEKIDLRQGDGGLWYVWVIFNGKHAQEISVDTGSTSIALPWAMAEKMDMKPGPNAPVVQAQPADGAIIDCRRIFAAKVRVGPFTVENVECSVFPEDCIHASALLGMSFLHHFNYKVDTDRGALVMTRIDTGDGKVSVDPDAGQAVKPGDDIGPPPEDPKDDPEQPKIVIIPPDEPPASKPADEKDAQIEQFAKMLASNQGRGVTVFVDGKLTQFSPSRTGPAERLKTKLGEPDAVVEVPSPNPAEKDAKWQIWSWRELQLLIDAGGDVRFMRYDK